VYAGFAEVAVYVVAGLPGAGLGRALLTALVEESERCGIWTLQAGIFPENLPSLRLHELCAFRGFGLGEHSGKMGTAWREVVLMERRSPVVGV
jgi:L-amino acid N-acyltransferase YncA